MVPVVSVSCIRRVRSQILTRKIHAVKLAWKTIDLQVNVELRKNFDGKHSDVLSLVAGVRPLIHPMVTEGRN